MPIIFCYSKGNKRQTNRRADLRMEEKNTQSSTVIDVCLIGIRGELLAFLHRHSGGQTRIVRGRNSESQRGTLFGGDRRDIGDEASFGTMCWHPDLVPKRAGHETSTRPGLQLFTLLCFVTAQLCTQYGCTVDVAIVNQLACSCKLLHCSVPGSRLVPGRM